MISPINLSDIVLKRIFQKIIIRHNHTLCWKIHTEAATIENSSPLLRLSPIPLRPEYKCLGAVVDSNSRRPINNERGFAARLPMEIKRSAFGKRGWKSDGGWGWSGVESLHATGVGAIKEGRRNQLVAAAAPWGWWSGRDSGHARPRD